MNKPKISIIIPVYNVSKELFQKCLGSVINQTYQELEILIIDDGSTSSNQFIYQDMQKNDSRIKYIYKENGGVSSARNIGIENATGDYIFFLDSDDYIDEEVLENLLSNYEENKLVSIYYKKIINNKKKLNKYEKTTYSSNNFIKGIINDEIGGFCWGYLFNSSETKKIGFDEKTNYMEDCIFLINYINQKKINEIEFIDKNNYYNYVFNDNSITNKNRNYYNTIKNIDYSLSQIDSLTNYQYSEKIEDKKIRIIERTLRSLNDKKELKNIIKNVELKKYNGNQFRYKLFSLLYRLNNTTLLKIYLKTMFILKKIIK